MGGEVGDHEIDVLRGAKAMDFVARQRLTRLFDLLPQLGIGQGTVSTDDGELGGIALGVLSQIIFENH